MPQNTLWWLTAIRQQAITWANVDPELCHHMVLLGHNELNIQFIQLSNSYTTLVRKKQINKLCHIKFDDLQNMQIYVL